MELSELDAFALPTPPFWSIQWEFNARAFDQSGERLSSSNLDMARFSSGLSPLEVLDYISLSYYGQFRRKYYQVGKLSNSLIPFT